MVSEYKETLILQVKLVSIHFLSVNVEYTALRGAVCCVCLFFTPPEGCLYRYTDSSPRVYFFYFPMLSGILGWRGYLCI